MPMGNKDISLLPEDKKEQLYAEKATMQRKRSNSEEKNYQPLSFLKINIMEETTIRQIPECKIWNKVKREFFPDEQKRFDLKTKYADKKRALKNEQISEEQARKFFQ